jgi:uncharacterized membrane protein YuzA (DUF378 family)
MVSDNMIFLRVPGFDVSFRAVKTTLLSILNNKTNFLYDQNVASRKSRRKGAEMKQIDVIAAALVIIGALNWGLAGIFHLDLVAFVFGMKFGETSPLSSVVYGLVGLAGLYQALTWKSIQRRWQPAAA